MKKKLLLSLVIFFAALSFISAETLNVNCNISGSAVYVDGRYAGVTPVSVNVSPGNHSIKVAKEGYYDVSGNAYVQSGSSATYSATLELKPTKGTVLVKANISSASVYLDGTYVGLTPCTIKDVSPGRHTIKATKEQYRDQRASVDVTAAETSTVTLSFVGADLNIETNVTGASVYIDSTYKGTTPLRLRNLEPGLRTIKISKNHYATYTTSVRLEAEKTQNFSVALEKISGYLNLSVIPAESLLYCDGESISARNEEIDEGSHTVKARAFGYYDKSETILIHRNQTTNHSMVLDKCPFKINSFAPSSQSFNPKNSKRLRTVKFKISVTAPENGTIVVKDSFDRQVASLNVSFKTWESSVEWDGRQNGNPLPEGSYTATLSAGGFKETTTVAIDYSIKNYAQRARSSGIFFDAAALTAPFGNGWEFGVSTFFGGSHLYGGFGLDVFYTNIKSAYKGYSQKNNLYMLDVEFLLGLSFNWHLMRPYVQGGIGYYNCMTEGVEYENSALKGLALSCTAGLDIVFDHFMLGGFYRFRKLYDCGNTNTFGLTIGWAFDDLK